MLVELHFRNIFEMKFENRRTNPPFSSFLRFGPIYRLVYTSRIFTHLSPPFSLPFEKSFNISRETFSIFVHAGDISIAEIRSTFNQVHPRKDRDPF